MENNSYFFANIYSPDEFFITSKELNEAKQDIEDEIDKIDIPSHYCNFTEPDDGDDDYF